MPGDCLFCNDALRRKPNRVKPNGAGNRVRTDDLLITNQLLYQLSYAGVYSVEVRFFLQTSLALYTDFIYKSI